MPWKGLLLARPQSRAHCLRAGCKPSQKTCQAPAAEVAAPSRSRAASAAAPRSLLFLALRLRSAAPFASLGPGMRSAAVRPGSETKLSLQSAPAWPAAWAAPAELPCTETGRCLSRGFTATRRADPCAASRRAAAAPRGLGSCESRRRSAASAPAVSAAGGGRRKSASRPSSSSPVKSVQRRGLPAMHR